MNKYLQPYSCGATEAFRQAVLEISAVNSYIEAIRKNRSLELEGQYEEMLRQQVNSLAGQNIIPLACCPAIEINSSYLRYLPDDFLEWVSYMSNTTSHPDFSIVLLAISCINIAMRGRYVVRLDDNWVEPSTLYILILAASGLKKSQLLDIGISPHKEFEEKLVSSFFSQRHRQREYASVMKKGVERLRREIIKDAFAESWQHPDGCRDFFRRIADKSNELAEVAKEFETSGISRPGLFIDSCTDKSLIRTMSERGGGHAIAQAEGEKLIAQMKDPRFDLNVFLKGHTMESYSHTTANDDIHIKNPFLNILMVVQPYIAARLYESERFADVGLTPRFLPFFVSSLDTEYNLEHTTARSDLSIYENKITAMLERNYTQDSDRKIHEITVTADAYEEIKKFEKEIAENCIERAPGHMKAFLRKFHGTAIRIASTIHAWNYGAPEKNPISKKEVLAGISIAQKIGPHAEYALNPSGLCAHENAQKILAWVRRHRHLRFNSRDAAQGSGVTTTTKIYPALDLLERHNMLTQLITPKKPRECVMHPRFDYHR